MLLVVRSRPTSVYVPVMFVLLTGGMLAATVSGFVATPSIGAGIGLLFVIGFFSFVLGMITVGTVDGGRIRSRSLFDGADVAHDRAWIGFTIQSGSKGSLEYSVVADDGSSRAHLATTWSRYGAERSVRRLRDAFGIVEAPEREAARRRLEGQVEAFARTQDEAKAYLRAQYAKSSTWITMLVVIGIFVIAYGIVMMFVLWGR